MLAPRVGIGKGESGRVVSKLLTVGGLLTNLVGVLALVWYPMKNAGTNGVAARNQPPRRVLDRAGFILIVIGFAMVLAGSVGE